MLVSYPSSEPEYSDGESISDNNDNDSNGNVQDESTPRPGKGARQERRADGDVASSRKRKASVGGAAVTTTMTTTTLTTAAATRTTTTTTTATSKSKPNLQAKSNLPALPPSFLDLYSANVRTCPTDDPAFHGGRKRQTPHVVGNWNTHVYLEWYPTQSQVHLLQSLETAVSSSLDPTGQAKANVSVSPSNEAGRLRPHYLSQFNNPAPLHVSLSAPLTLQTDRRDEFLTELTHRLRTRAVATGEDDGSGTVSHTSVRPFEARLDGLKWVSNADRSRWFLAAGVRPVLDRQEDCSDGNPNMLLDNLLSIVNGVAGSFGLAKLYPHRTLKKDKPPSSSVDVRQGRDGTTPACGAAEDPLARLARHGGGGGGVRSVVSSEKGGGGADSMSQSPFHVSLLWTLDPPPIGTGVRPTETGGGGIIVPVRRTDGVDEALARLEEAVVMRFDDVKIKIGNKVHSASLDPST